VGWGQLWVVVRNLEWFLRCGCAIVCVCASGPGFIFHIFALAVVKGCVGVAKVLPYILNMLVRPCWPVAAAKRKSGQNDS